MDDGVRDRVCARCGRPLGEGPCVCETGEQPIVGVSRGYDGWLPALVLTGLAVVAVVVIAVALILERSPRTMFSGTMLTGRTSTVPIASPPPVPRPSAQQVAPSMPALPEPPSPPTTTRRAPAPTSTADSDAELAGYTVRDLPGLRADAEGRWVPQLSSKRPGQSANGVIYDNELILQDHLTLRSTYPGTRLVWSGDWSSFKQRDYWVTVAGARFDTADEANHWCAAQGLPKDDCYAKRLSTTGGHEGNTKVR